MKSRTAWALTGLLIMAMAVTACGGSGSASQADYKDTITWGQGADVTSFDPHVGRQTPAVTVTSHIFDTLVEVDGVTNEVIPQIAESWEQLSDTDYRFHIRKGIKFHDGSDLTAEDVKFSLERAIASSFIAYVTDFISAVKIEDPYTVIVTTKEPYGPTLRNLSVPFVAILPKAYTEANPDAILQHPIGCGPYKFVSWIQSDSCTMEAFEDYYGGVPKTQNLVMKVIPEASQRTIALQTGEIDLAYDIPTNDRKIVQGDQNLTLFTAPSLTCTYMSMNTLKKPFDNKLVRQAVSHAIDRQLIVDTVLSGAAQAADAVIAPAVFGYYSTGVPSYDPALSKSLLAEAGFPNGFSATLWVNNSQERVDVSTAIVEMLREAGINIKLEVMEAGAFWDKTDNGEHEMALLGWVTSTKDADYTYYSLCHSSKHGPGGNATFLTDAEVDALVEKGRFNLDPQVRLQAYKDLAIRLADLSDNANIMYSQITAGGLNKVENFILDPIGYHKLEKVQVRQ